MGNMMNFPECGNLFSEKKIIIKLTKLVMLRQEEALRGDTKIMYTEMGR
jgi:hypothetical protein